MKRRWFQIHLSTAIVMMVLVAFFMYLNFLLRMELETHVRYEADSSSSASVSFLKTGNVVFVRNGIDYQVTGHIGWPFTFMSRLLGEGWRIDPQIDLSQYRVDIPEFLGGRKLVIIGNSNFDSNGLICNALVLIALLIICRAMLEGLIRRRERRRLPAEPKP
jgi:hypothetical protein